MIYLDNGATSFPKPPGVGEAVMAALAAPASPGRSGHAPALAASRVIHRARKALARLFGLGDNSRLCFGPNVTWALNAALSGLGLGRGDHVLSGSLEHNSTARPLTRLKNEAGVDWEIVPPIDGRMDPGEFRRRLRPDTRLVVLNHASNVSGALAPARAIKEAIGPVPLLLDTAQTAGSVPLEDAGSWVDILAFTGHKGLLGPTGTGGLWVRPGLSLRPLAVGGSGSLSESLGHPDFLPDALEAGTANTHGLAGLAAGVEYVLETGTEAIRDRELALTGLFLEAIGDIRGLGLLGPGPGEGDRVATVALNLAGWSSSDLAA
ncbi:MAG: aminotransferase class V-fold PLP-dependent enzyme, partial [Deltaproteobacteria bacterium]|nr:aminotransferase class V-fold PLP-dependent enzyme [Deltaproteobacteria bacterium]